jgi:hypothetical protein
MRLVEVAPADALSILRKAINYTFVVQQSPETWELARLYAFKGDDRPKYETPCPVVVPGI